jgi:hypothetical protein
MIARKPRQKRVLGKQVVLFREMAPFFQVLPLEQTRELRLAVQKVEIAFQQPRQLLARTPAAAERIELNRFQPPINLGQGRLEQRVLAAEIVINHPLVDPRPPDNLVHRHGVKPLLREQADRRLQDPPPRAVGITLSRTGGHRSAP